MSEQRAISATAEARQAATRLARQVEWSEGFWLAYVFTIDANQANLVRERVHEALTARGTRLRVLRPATPEELQLGAILGQGEDDADPCEVGCTWVEAIREPMARGGAWTKGWLQLILRTNERRELLRERLGGGLVLVMHPSLKPEVRGAGPDLWSIRAVVFELPAGAQSMSAPVLSLPLGPSPFEATPSASTPQRFVDAQLLDRDLARWSEVVEAMPAPERARTLLELGERLRGVGRQEEAGATGELALSSFRELARTEPETETYNLLLAQALEARASDLATLGREGEAVGLLSEAVGLLRANAGVPGGGNLSLAKALYRLGVHAAALGRQEQAEPALREAADLLRGLSASSRGAGFTRNAQIVLASTLIQLGVGLSAQGRLVEALEFIQAAGELVRTFAEPEREGFGPALTAVLSNLSQILSTLGRYEEALEAGLEAVELSRVDPVHDRQGLAMSLYNLGNVLIGVGRREDALEATREAVNILDELVGSGERVLLVEAGRGDDAQSVTREALTIYRLLEGAPPGAYERELGTALHSLARQLAFGEGWQEMLTVAEQAVQLRRRLAESGGESLRRQLAQSLSLLAAAHEQLGEAALAVEALTEALRTLALDVGGDDPLTQVLTKALVHCCEANSLEFPEELASQSSEASPN